MPRQGHVDARPQECVWPNGGEGPPKLTRAEIYDNSGKMLYNLAEKLMSLHKTTVGEGAHGKEVLRVKKKWSSECWRFELHGSGH